jgi:hypothetical protein
MPHGLILALGWNPYSPILHSRELFGPIAANTIERIRSASNGKPGRDKRPGGEFAREVPRFSCRNHKRSLGLGEDGMMHPWNCSA